jgi:hypothetical protein
MLKEGAFLTLSYSRGKVMQKYLDRLLQLPVSVLPNINVPGIGPTVSLFWSPLHTYQEPSGALRYSHGVSVGVSVQLVSGTSFVRQSRSVSLGVTWFLNVCNWTNGGLIPTTGSMSPGYCE